VTDFISENLTGSRFEDVYLTGARFHDVDLTDAHFHLVDLTGVVIRGALLVNVDNRPDQEPAGQQAILNEEGEHRVYAERDFDVLQARSP
jgi:uncharacterized protein YjbI with pentapeptide repeats